MNDLYVVGLGPGGAEHMTGAARGALERAEVICAYTVYADLVRPLYPGKEYLTTPMTRELDRCRAALESAAGGRITALVCGGDPGVYGLAGPLLGMAEAYPSVEIIPIPGVTAASAGAAVLGAPLMGDFCVISLSDRLTPWEVIARRLTAAAAGDFVICIYNPASRSRPDHLRRACDILLETLPPETPCGWVRNIARPGQESRVLPLGALREERVDMFTTVYIGNSATRRAGAWLLTPRGYGAGL